MSISLLPLVKLLFNDNNPGVTKIKNTQYDSVYVCECKSMLRKERHYMFVIGSVDVIPIGSNVQIEDVNNITCIQFRTFQEPILQQVLLNYIDFDPSAGDISIKRYNISKDTNGKKISEYMFEYDRKPYNVHIFHATDSDYEFIADGNLLSALITWDTMIMPSIDVGSPPPINDVVGSDSPRYYRTEQIPPLPRLMTSNIGNDDLQFERRARPQVRPGRNTIQPSGPLPPQQPRQMYPMPIPSQSFTAPPSPPQPKYPLGPLSQPPVVQQQSQPQPQPPVRQPQRGGRGGSRGRGGSGRPQQPRPQPPTPPPSRKRVAFKEPEFNPRPGSTKNSSYL